MQVPFHLYNYKALFSGPVTYVPSCRHMKYAIMRKYIANFRPWLSVVRIMPSPGQRVPCPRLLQTDLLLLLTVIETTWAAVLFRRFFPASAPVIRAEAGDSSSGQRSSGVADPPYPPGPPPGPVSRH